MTETATEVAPARQRGRVAMAGAVITLAVGFLLWRGLDDATLYFRTADEAVAQRAELGTRRFRIEGDVVAGSIRERQGAVLFAIEENGVRVDVRHRGEPPDLFQPGIPVVLEGRFDGERFESDRILVRHSEEYQEQNPERVRPERGEELRRRDR